MHRDSWGKMDVRMVQGVPSEKQFLISGKYLKNGVKSLTFEGL